MKFQLRITSRRGERNYLGTSKPWASCLSSYGKGRGLEAHAEVKQNLKHYPSWAESIGKLGLKTLCGCPQKAKCHVQVTVRVCSAVKTLQKSGGKLLTIHKSLSFQVY